MRDGDSDVTNFITSDVNDLITCDVTDLRESLSNKRQLAVARLELDWSPSLIHRLTSSSKRP